MKNMKIFGPIMLALILTVALLWGMNTAQAAQPGPLMAPTPVSVSAASGAPGEAVFFATSVLTEDTYSEPTLIKGFQRTDIQHALDQGTVNTTTLTIQFSNDGVNWEDGAALVSNNAADAALLQQVAVFGKWARVYANVTNSNPITVTTIAVLK